MIRDADLKFIEQYSPNQQKWARFSSDMLKRYRLGACLTPRIIECGWTGFERIPDLVRVVFLLLNPSTATAFKPDNTFTKCVQFAQIWGADVMEIVNLFAFRTQYPQELKLAVDRGDDEVNDAQILQACKGAFRVVAGWGNDGEIEGRDAYVRVMLERQGIQLYHLGKTSGGMPKHPLARGKHFIPLTQIPEVY